MTKCSKLACPEVTTPLLKFMAEFVNNKSQRITSGLAEVVAHLGGWIVGNRAGEGVGEV